MIDGFEAWLGLDADAADFDKNGVPDGIELPAADAAVSDACPGGKCDKTFVLADGYE